MEGEAPAEPLTRTAPTPAPAPAPAPRSGNGAGGTTLARQLRALIAVTSQGDERGMIRALSAIVTEYQPERLELVGTNGNGLGLKRNGNGNGHRPRHTNGNGATRRRLRRAAGPLADLTPPVPAAPTLAPDTLEPPGGAVAGGGTAP